MKYTIKKDIWQDLVTGQFYKKAWAFRPLVSFGVNGEIISGYVYDACDGVEEGDLKQWEKLWETDEEFGYPALCRGQSLFLTNEQVAQRFKFLGNFPSTYSIDESIAQYSDECCDFDSREWVAELTLMDLSHSDSGGLTQCIHAKIFEFYLEHAIPDNERSERIKESYYNENKIKK